VNANQDIDPAEEPNAPDQPLPAVPEDGPTEVDGAKSGQPGGESEGERAASSDAEAPVSQYPATEPERDVPDPSGPDADEGAQPTEVPVTSLPEFLAVQKGEELPRRLLRHMAAEKRERFSREEQAQALALLADADPELRRVRSLLRAARQSYDGAFETTVTDFVRAALVPVVPDSFRDPSQSPRERFADVVASQTAALRDKATGRRPLNVILLSLEILADAGLSMEDAIPLLRDALGEERPSRTGRLNPRRDRLAQLADVQMTPGRLRQRLGLIEPWEQMAAEARAEREAAARREAVAREDQDDALRRVVERDDEIERLRASLEQARQELAALRDQLRDAGSAGRSDVAGVRARALSFLKGRLRPSLETGREAAEAAQPNERVMRRMIIDTLYEVDREIEWLTSLD
jgi:hypothetical protein